jgi:hypothetical protein
MMQRRAPASGVPRYHERVRGAALLPRSAQDKDTKILALRHQLAVPQRHLGYQRVRLPPVDRASPHANTYAQRPVLTERMLIFGDRHLLARSAGWYG